jgi:hypothetical protein
VEMLPPIETVALVDVELKLKGTVKFRVIFSILEIVEVEDDSLLLVGKLFLWTLDVSAVTVDSTVVTLSSGIDEKIGSLISPIVLDDFFVKPDIFVTLSSPVVDGVIEGISSVLFTSFISEAVIEDEMVSVTTADSDIFGVSATNVVLNGAEFVELFELLNVSVVVLSAICVDLVISEDVSFGRSVVELYSVEIKLIVGDETILFSVEMLSCVVDEIVGDDGVKMMGAVKFSGVEVEDVSLLIVETLYSLLVNVSTTSVESSGSTSSVIVGVSVNLLVDLVPLGD